jgi:hypothetical protein
MPEGAASIAARSRDSTLDVEDDMKYGSTLDHRSCS